MMTTTQDRNQDEIAKAAKVIRILHKNHAAASDYLYSLHDASDMSPSDFRSYLHHAPLEEYSELVEPLDKSQKAALYDKVARMKDRTPTSPIDKETTKSFFKLLELKEKGLSLKDVRKEVKKTAPSVDHTPASLAVTTPQPEASTKKKRKRMEEPPAGQPTLPASRSTSNVDRQPKKQRTKAPAVQPPLETPARPALNRNQRKREAKKARRAAMSISLANEEIQAPTAPDTTPRPEPEAPAPPHQKKQKTRRSRRKPKVTSSNQSGSPAVNASSAKQPSPEQEEIATSLSDHKPSASANGTSLHLHLDEFPPNDANVPPPASHSPSPVHETEVSVPSTSIENTTQADEAPLSSSSSEKETSRPSSPHRESPAHDIDVQMTSPKYEPPPQSVASSSASYRSPSQVIATPISSKDHESPGLDADVKSSSPAQASAAQNLDLPTSSPKNENPASAADRAISSPERTTDAHDTDLPASPSLHESPPLKSSIPISITRTALPLTNKPAITTTIETAVEPPPVERPNSPRLGSSSEFDLRAGPIAFSMPVAASNPIESRTERRSVTSRSPVGNDASQPLAAAFARAQSSRSSAGASPFSGRPRVIPSSSAVTNNSNFRNFSRFLSGKGPDEDDSSSDDDSSSSSSSSSSEDEADVRLSQSRAQAGSQLIQQERQREIVGVESSATNADAANEQPILIQETDTTGQNLVQEEESSDESESEVHKDPDVAGVQPVADLKMTGCPFDEPDMSIEDAGCHVTEQTAEALEDRATHASFGPQEHPPSYRVTSPSPARDEDNKSSIQRTDKPDLVTFTSFHDTLSPQDDPSTSPMPEIPDLMDFGGYHPIHDSEPASSILPGSSQPAPEATGFSNRDSEDEQVMEQGNDENVVQPTAINENLNSSNNVSESGPTIQTSDPSSPNQVNDIDPEVNQEEAPNVDDTRSSSPISFFGSDDITEEQTKLLDGFRGVFEQSEEQFLTRMASLRSRLELGTSGTLEGRKAMFDELLEEITREEAVHVSKLSAARRAVERDVPEARLRMFKIIDHAGERFEQTITSTRTTLQKEYNEDISGSQLPVGAKAEDTVRDVARPEAMVIVETPSKTYRAQFANSSFASEQAYEATFANTQEEGEKDTSGAPESSESVHDEESLQQEPQKKKRKTTGLASKHFATPSPAKKKRVPAGTSAVPFPKLSAPRFGLIQEELAGDPFCLLIAVTFLNKTAGKAAVPIYRQLMEQYPTATDLAAASIPDISDFIRPLGLQNQRAKKLVRLAQTWVENPPQKGIRHRTRDYPVHGDGRDLKPTQTLQDAENCAGALEIGHMYGLGPYAYDSWRIFCRDVFRGVAQGYNGQGIQGYSATDATSQSTFEPEWKRVVPLDKELRACLRWMWLREGWEWDPLTGKKKVANVELVREASNGVATWDEPDGTPAKEDSSVDGSGVKSEILKTEIDSPGMANVSSDVPDETLPSPPVPRRATRSSTRLRLSRKLEDEVKLSPGL